MIHSVSHQKVSYQIKWEAARPFISSSFFQWFSSKGWEINVWALSNRRHLVVTLREILYTFSYGLWSNDNWVEKKRSWSFFIVYVWETLLILGGRFLPPGVAHPMWLFEGPLSGMSQYKAVQKRVLTSWRKEEEEERGRNQYIADGQ